jgi:hypothetical protein
VVVECDAQQAVEAQAWLEKVMIEGMDTVMNGTRVAHTCRSRSRSG